ncbi:MAG: hypothetical protein CMJ64_03420 [Planctomycetaceae bacterium]|nr:hypothetical protein [Planctomycetaceae bacterium]
MRPSRPDSQAFCFLQVGSANRRIALWNQKILAIQVPPDYENGLAAVGFSLLSTELVRLEVTVVHAKE